VVWGTVNARREFLDQNDMADTIVFVMNLPVVYFREELLSYTRQYFVNVGN
jgi:hypothetical protein